MTCRESRSGRNRAACTAVVILHSLILDDFDILILKSNLYDNYEAKED